MFVSVFKDEFNEYIKYKKSMGYDYSKTVINTYARLDKYFNENNLITKEIKEELYDNWLKKRVDESNNNHAIRYSVIRQFCTYLI